MWASFIGFADDAGALWGVLAGLSALVAVEALLHLRRSRRPWPDAAAPIRASNRWPSPPLGGPSPKRPEPVAGGRRALARGGWLTGPALPLVSLPLVVLLLVAASAIDAQPEPPARLSAFLRAQSPDSFRSLRRNHLRIREVYPTYFRCHAGRALTGFDHSRITGWAAAHRVRVLPRYFCDSPGALRALLHDTALRRRTTERLVALVLHHGYDGISLDFEGGDPRDRHAFTRFASHLSARLHAIGRTLVVAVAATTDDDPDDRSAFYDYDGLARVADEVFVMNWGRHWSTSAPGPIDPLPWATRVADYVARRPNAARFTLGFPAYGLDWTGRGGPRRPAAPLTHREVLALLERPGSVARFDPVAHSPYLEYRDATGRTHTVHYADARSVAARIRLATERGLGAGFWRLGQEDQAIWSGSRLPGG